MSPSVGELLDSAAEELRHVRAMRLGLLAQAELDNVATATVSLLASLERLSRAGVESRWPGTAGERGWRSASSSMSRTLAYARDSVADLGSGVTPTASPITDRLLRIADLYGAAADLMGLAAPQPGGPVAVAPLERTCREIIDALAPQLHPLSALLAEWSSVVRNDANGRSRRTADVALAVANSLTCVAEEVTVTEATWGTPSPTRDVPVTALHPQEMAVDHAASALRRAINAADALVIRADPPSNDRWTLETHTPSVLAGQAVAFSIGMDVTARLLDALSPAVTDGQDDPRSDRLADAVAHARVAQHMWADVRVAWAGVRSDWEAPRHAPVREDAQQLAVQIGRVAFADPNWRLPPGPRDELRDTMEFRDDPEALASLLNGLDSITVSIATLATAHRSIVSHLSRGGHLIVPTRTISEERDEPWPYARPDHDTVATILTAYDEAGRGTCRAAKALTPLADLLAPGGTRVPELAPMRVKDLALEDLLRQHNVRLDEPVQARGIA